MDSYNPVQRNQRGTWNRCFTVVGALAMCFGIWLLLLRPTANVVPTISKAVVVLKGDSGVEGIVTFTQKSSTSAVTISGEVYGLNTDAKHGFHVHELGNTTGGCLSTGSHFNPDGNTHGAPSDQSSKRHAGDLGNIQSDSNGTAKLSLTDGVISLNGAYSIIGRSVVVHAGTDDLGKGGNEESLKTGNAGGRAACGVIGLA